MNSNARPWQGILIIRGYLEGSKNDFIIGTTRVIAKSLMETISVSPMSLPLIPSGLLSFVSRPRWPRGHRPTLLRFLLLAIWASTNPYFHYLHRAELFSALCSLCQWRWNRENPSTIITHCLKIIWNYFSINDICILVLKIFVSIENIVNNL